MTSEVIEAAIRANIKAASAANDERKYWYEEYKTRTNPQDRLSAVTMELKAINARDNAIKEIAELIKKRESIK